MLQYGLHIQRNGRLTIGHKANVLKSDVLFRDICLAEAKAAGVSCNDKFIDALALDILQHPASYDVVVTTNIFGDILSDVASYLVGGLGLVPSANIGDRHALFEPVHGSAPDIAGKNIANPIAALRSAGMLLTYCGDAVGSERIETAVQGVLAEGIRTRDLGGSAGTREFGDAVLFDMGISNNDGKYDDGDCNADGHSDKPHCFNHSRCKTEHFFVDRTDTRSHQR